MSVDRDQRGYRAEPGPGPRVRCDVVDVYVAREAAPSTRARDDDPRGAAAPAVIEVLQVRRAREPLKGSWQPVMGHIEAGELAPAAARREVMEEVALDVASAACLGFWALEQVHPFYIAAIDCIVMSPRFLARVDAQWEPRLNAEHTEHRWVDTRRAAEFFAWPGQHGAITEVDAIVRGTSLGAVWTRLG
ncbi:hypothetical protein BH11PLA1_BH11PLA1_01290 [soil metagenome]